MTTFLQRQLRPAIALIVLLTLVTGLAYPVVVTAISQVVFPGQANGSLVVVNGQTLGSSLIGQAFNDPKYLWGRPSNAGVTPSNPAGYDGTASGGSNLGPTSAALIKRIQASIVTWQASNGSAPIPIDLLTTSASGLDPDISPAGAEYQVARVAKARNMTEDAVRAIIAKHTDQPILGFMGEPAVNVFEVNLDLDGLLK